MEGKLKWEFRAPPADKSSSGRNSKTVPATVSPQKDFGKIIHCFNIDWDGKESKLDKSGDLPFATNLDEASGESRGRG